MPRAGFKSDSVEASGFIRTKNIKLGTEISAVYLGSYIDDTYKKPNHKLELVADVTLPVQANKKDGGAVTEKQFTKGQTIILNSAATLDRGLAKYPVGTDLDIVYSKDGVVKKGPHAGDAFRIFDIYAAPGSAVAQADADDSVDETAKLFGN